MYLAHITMDEEKKKVQFLKDHCQNVARYASDTLGKIGFRKLGYLAGIIHDMGKYSDRFQKYLEDSFNGENTIRGSVNHTFAGVVYLLEKYHVGKNRNYDTMACEVIAYAAGAHHGEFDSVNFESKSGFEHRLYYDKEELEYEQVVARFQTECMTEEKIDEAFKEATEEIHAFYNKIKVLIQREHVKEEERDFLLGMLARMALSAVINADRRDTAEFMEGRSFTFKKMSKEEWNEQLEFMEDKIGAFRNDTPLNEARCYISNRCAKFAERGDGSYKIAVPTGGGKTLSTLRYALRLAEKTEKEHIIFIIPLLSVLDQNSQVIREYIKEEKIVLEHHSNVVHTMDDNELDRYELLAETWDSPVIISTLYQILMSLFSDKTTAIRRMQSLINSVIIIDEAQSLPFKLTYQFNMAFNFLATFCNTTLLLSSATQPCFEKLEVPLWFSSSPDMVVLQDEMRQVFKRTSIQSLVTPEGMTMDELTELDLSLLKESHSVLTICNTKKTAKELFEKIKLRNVEGEFELFHLSTAMCMRHRLQTLQEIRECLDARRKMICVATQLVEAGIDFSFECVIRVCAGMDDIAQAAGRCNRNFDYGHICNVYLVKLKEENLSMLKEIKLAQDCTQNLLIAFNARSEEFHNDLLSDESLSFYYKDLFDSLERDHRLCCPVKTKHGEREELYALLTNNKKYNTRPEYRGKYFLKQAFKTAGSLFEVYDARTTDVLVPYNEEARSLITDLLSKRAQFDLAYMKECLKKAKQYSIQVWEYQKEKLFEDGLIYSDDSGHILFLQQQCYNDETGLDTELFMV